MKMFLKIRFYKYYYAGTDISKGIDLAKSKNSKECIICSFGYLIMVVMIC